MKNAILKAIKAHNNEAEYLNEYNKGIKLRRLIPDNENEVISFMVECEFKADKWEDNIVLYKVYLYENGDLNILFGGTRYEA